MAKKILIVTKDIGEFNVYEPVVRSLIEKGVRVHVVAEGLSLEKWALNGYVTQAGADFVTDEAIRNLFKVYQPNIVLTGLGAPINLGEKFGLVANQFGIKLGYVHDLWGVHKRSSAIPQFVCVTDEFDAKLVCNCKIYWSYLGGRMPTIYITGSPAMDSLTDVEPDDTVTEMLTVGGRSILVLGQNECTTPMLEGLITALDVSGQPYILVPRFHPKFANNDELRHVWLSLLYRAKKGKVLFVENSVSTRQLMRETEFTVSVFSTGLIEATMFGSYPVSWISPLGREQMKQALGVERFPLVDMGCASEVSNTEEWQALFSPTRGEMFNRYTSFRSKLQLDGNATERVVNAIFQELG